MRIVSLRLTGYRRFLNARMSLDAPVIAIVGPNQAGKSSFLDALVELDSPDAIAESDLTRSNPPAPTATVLEARYRIDDAARETLNKNDIEAPLFFVQRKRRDGTFRYLTEPPLVRDMAPRIRAKARLEAAAASEWAKSLPDFEEETVADDGTPSSVNVPAASRLSELATTLSVGDQILNTETLELIDEIEAALQGGPDRTHQGQLRQLLAKLSVHEKAEHPANTCARLLKQHLPEFLAFEPEEHNLEPEYEFATLDLDDPPPALENLASVAGIDLAALQTALSTGEPSDIVNILDPANEQLRRALSDAWSRANFFVRLEPRNSRLHVLTERKPGKWASIAESSDGMRAFAALLVFAQQHPTASRPVFLIDEAETHLHYEGQVDLVRVFERQEAAEQVIYTTHSAGCLPQDLGRGVRVVGQIPETDTSEIRSSFWTLGQGFSPLVIAMGASALAFTPTRFAIIAEGGSETLLLPTLLREATELPNLKYQIAPGLANASPTEIRELGFEAGGVAWIVDSDRGGRENRKKLRRAGVTASRIVFLGRGPATGLSVEDFLDAGIYSEALNTESAGRHGPGHTILASQLPAKGRAGWVNQWYARKGLGPPSKTDVASRALELAEGRSLSAKSRRPLLRTIHQRLEAALGT